MQNPAGVGGAQDQAGGRDRAESNPPDTKTQGARLYFGALPARAIGDQRLSTLHYKALGAVALHDRMAGATGKGQGCWASRKRLAEEIGCNYSNLSTALTQLATWGYIERRPHPMSKKQHVLHVIYTAKDAAFVKEFALPTGKPSDEVVCPDSQKTPELHEVAEDKYIPQKRETDFAEAREENSAEAAPPYVGAPAMKDEVEEDATFLRKVEAAFKATSGRHLTKGELDYFRHNADQCAMIEDKWLSLGGSEEEERVGYWAQRLAGEIMDKMDAAA